MADVGSSGTVQQLWEWIRDAGFALRLDHGLRVYRKDGNVADQRKRKGGAFRSRYA